MRPRKINIPVTTPSADSARSQDSRPMTVGEVARRVARALEEGVGSVYVVGEVSNARVPSSGHCYFVLKDADAAINAVCFRPTLQRQGIVPREGMELEIRGRLTAYLPRSEYQIIIESMREAGLGDLMRRFLALKEQLAAEGIFAQERKLALPKMPRRIGIVTSSTGAALRDMLNVLRRRVRGMEIYLAHAAVQGDAAPGEIVAALARLQRHARAEVIIVGRGGGSIEDLWAFNSEIVVRAIAASLIPIISAVGHETDTTLADYAAVLRAATPSAAAELVSAHYGEAAERLEMLKRGLRRAGQGAVESRRARLERCVNSWGMRQPRERLQTAMQRHDELRERLLAALPRAMRRRRDALDALTGRLARARPEARLKLAAERFDQLQRRLASAGPRRIAAECAAVRSLVERSRERMRLLVRHRLRETGARLASAGARLRASNPDAVLLRGYSIVTLGSRERIVTGPGQAAVGAVVRIRGAAGAWRAAALGEDPDMFEISAPIEESVDSLPDNSQSDGA